jgi:hypothetical protein
VGAADDFIIGDIHHHVGPDEIGVFENELMAAGFDDGSNTVI